MSTMVDSVIQERPGGPLVRRRKCFVIQQVFVMSAGMGFVLYSQFAIGYFSMVDSGIKINGETEMRRGRLGGCEWVKVEGGESVQE